MRWRPLRAVVLLCAAACTPEAHAPTHTDARPIEAERAAPSFPDAKPPKRVREETDPDVMNVLHTVGGCPFDHALGFVQHCAELREFQDFTIFWPKDSRAVDDVPEKQRLLVASCLAARHDALVAVRAAGANCIGWREMAVTHALVESLVAWLEAEDVLAVQRLVVDAIERQSVDAYGMRRIHWRRGACDATTRVLKKWKRDSLIDPVTVDLERTRDKACVEQNGPEPGQDSTD